MIVFYLYMTNIASNIYSTKIKLISEEKVVILVGCNFY